MALHWVRIIEQGHLSTRRLFELSLGLATCREKGMWPSLKTVNTLLSRGSDDGNLGTDIEWEPFEITANDYLAVVADLMGERDYAFDNSALPWDAWFNELSSD
jgi:hypothetical protein